MNPNPDPALEAEHLEAEESPLRVALPHVDDPEPFIAAEVWAAARDEIDATWRPGGRTPLAHFVVDPEGAVLRANAIRDERPVGIGFDPPAGPLVLAYADGRLEQVRAEVVGIDPSGDLVMRTMPILDECRAFALGLAAAFREAGRAAESLGAALRPLFPTEPPTDPRARALWLRQHRNTGPRQHHRAPREITPRRTR